jgi:hypothetical protein
MNGNLSFQYAQVTLVEAQAKFHITPNLSLPIPVGPTTFSIDSTHVIPKYTVIHIISAQVKFHVICLSSI